MKKILKSIAGLLAVCICAGAVGYHFSPTARTWIQSTAAELGVSNTMSSVSSTIEATLQKTDTENVIRGEGLIGEEEIPQALCTGILNHETSIVLNVRTAQSDSDYLLDLVESALTAIRRAYPQIFWMSLDEYGVQWSPREDCVHMIVELSYCYSPSQAQSISSQLENAVAAIAADTPVAAYEAAKYLHDWLVDNISYDTETAAAGDMSGHESAFNITGVFLDSRAVCEGYAKAYKILCDAAGVPCEIVFGTLDGDNHAWNYVQLEGAWYLVDCTSDDPVNSRPILRWDYFLKGTSGIAGEQTVGSAYLPDRGDYPALSSSDYSGGNSTQPTDSTIGKVFALAAAAGFCGRSPFAFTR